LLPEKLSGPNPIRRVFPHSITRILGGDITIATTILVGYFLLFHGMIIYHYKDFVVDDAYIVARYAENFYRTGSLEYNPGEPISALTSPLHAFLEVGLYTITRDTIVSYKYLCGILLLMSIFTLLINLRAPVYYRLLFFIAIGLSPIIMLWTFAGLETPILFLLFSTLLVLAQSQEKYSHNKHIGIGILVGLLFLTRYDTVLFSLPLYLWYCYGKTLKGAFLSALIAGLISVGWLIFSYIYFGDIMPTSYYVKQPQFDISIIKKNISYFFQFTLISGLLPVSLVLFSYPHSKRVKLHDINRRLMDNIGIFLGLLLIFGYSLSVATTHMMFAYRFYVPFLPIIFYLLLSSDLFVPLPRASNSSNHHFFILSTILIFTLYQLAANWYVYTKSVNPVFFGKYEFTQVSVSESNSILYEFPIKMASDIRKHWSTVMKKEGHAPRIYTYAAGIMPFYYPDAYIYEILVSYRHHCRYDWKYDADYVNIIYPLHGPLDKQLSQGFEHFSLVSSYTFEFEGNIQHYSTYYNPNPLPNKLPPKIYQPCISFNN
jgi:hypothetical protein